MSAETRIRGAVTQERAILIRLWRDTGADWAKIASNAAGKPWGRGLVTAGNAEHGQALSKAADALLGSRSVADGEARAREAE